MGTIDDLIEDICENSTNALRMLAFIKLFLQLYFSDDANIEHTSLKDNIWTDGDDARIIIEFGYDWLPKKQEDKRPSILLNRGKYLYNIQGIGHGKLSDAEKYVGIWQGQHIITCSARSLLETEILVDEVTRLLISHADYLRKQAGLLMLRVVEVGNVEASQEYNRYSANIIISYAWEETWFLDKSENVFKKLQISIV